MLRITKTESGMVRGLPALTPATLYSGASPLPPTPPGRTAGARPSPPKVGRGFGIALSSPLSPCRRCRAGIPTPSIPRSGHVDPQVPMSEEGSLCLNIWTSSKTVEEKLPVMVCLRRRPPRRLLP